MFHNHTDIVHQLLGHRQVAYRSSSSSTDMSDEDVERFSTLLVTRERVIIPDPTEEATPDYYPVVLNPKFADFIENTRDPYLGKFKSVLARFNMMYNIKFKDKLLDNLGKLNSRGQTLAYVAARFRPELAFDLLFQCAKRGHKLDDMRNDDGCTPQHGYAWGLKTGVKAEEDGPLRYGFIPEVGLRIVFWRFGCDTTAKNNLKETVDSMYAEAKLHIIIEEEEEKSKDLVGMDNILDNVAPICLTYMVDYEILGDHEITKPWRTMLIDSKFATLVKDAIKTKQSWSDFIDKSVQPFLTHELEEQAKEEMEEKKNALIQILSKHGEH